MAKEIHPVFQVLNYIDSNPDYTFTEKMTLIFLARFKGKKGIYPSIPLLAKKLTLSLRQCERIINSLAKKKTIKITHRLGKSSEYELCIITPTPDTHDGGQDTNTPDTHDGIPPTSMTHTPDTHDGGSPLYSNPVSNPEREREVDALSLLKKFIPRQSETDLILEKGLNPQWVLDKFKTRYISRETYKKVKDINAEFYNWVLNEREKQ